MWIGPTLTAAAYLSGSVCFGILAARRAGVDLRAIGSGNVGATNVGVCSFARGTHGRGAAHESIVVRDTRVRESPPNVHGPVPKRTCELVDAWPFRFEVTPEGVVIGRTNTPHALPRTGLTGALPVAIRGGF